MSKRRIILIYAGFMVLVLFGIKIGWVIPDGAAHTSYNASLILDGDLNFWNQYTSNGIITPTLIHGSTITSKGYVCMLWTVGAPLLWMFFWLIGDALTRLSGIFGQPWTPNGFTIYYNIGVKFATAIMGLSAITMLFSIARKYAQQSSALFAMILVVLGTPFYWYLFNGGDLTHIPAVFVVALFLLTWLTYRSGNREPWKGFLLGMLGGLAIIVKPNHIVIFLFPLLMWITEAKRLPARTIFRQIVTVVIGASFSIFLQFWIWNILFGNPLGPILEKGVTHYYGFFVGKFWLLDILFSSYHGLFFFSPVLIFSFYGLFKLIKKDNVFAIASLLMITFQLLLMANERYLWEGAAFGLRRLVDLTPILGVGLATALPDFKKGWKALPIIATLWTILLMLTYNGRPLGVLNDYQPPELLLKWQWLTLRQLPAILSNLIRLPVPASLLLPAIVAFAVPGFFLFYGCVRLSKATQPSKVFLLILLCLFGTGYALVSRAAIRSDASLEQSRSGLRWLAQNEQKIAAMEEVAFLINEGKYIALSRNWIEAKPSFVEALSTTINRAATFAEIQQFASTHLPPDQAREYIDSLR